MGDSELEEIRAKRLAQLRSEYGVRIKTIVIFLNRQKISIGITRNILTITFHLKFFSRIQGIHLRVNKRLKNVKNKQLKLKIVFYHRY